MDSNARKLNQTDKTDSMKEVLKQYLRQRPTVFFELIAFADDDRKARED